MIGERLKELRANSELTQQQLADKLKVSVMSVSNYELGIRVPDAEYIRKVAMLFKVSSDYILGLVNTKQKQNASIGVLTGLNDKAINALKEAKEQDKRALSDIINFIMRSTAFQRMVELVNEAEEKTQGGEDEIEKAVLDKKIGDILNMEEAEKETALNALFPLYQKEISKAKDFELEQCINALQRELVVKYLSTLYIFPPAL